MKFRGGRWHVGGVLPVEITRSARFGLHSAVAAMTPLERAALLAILGYGEAVVGSLSTVLKDDQSDANLAIEAVSGLDLLPSDEHPKEVEMLRDTIAALMAVFGEIIVEEEVDGGRDW